MTPEGALPQAWRDTAWAMSEENVELAYRALDSFNRKDLDGFLAVQAENVGLIRLAAVEGVPQPRWNPTLVEESVRRNT